MHLQQYKHRGVLTVRRISSLLPSLCDIMAYVNMTLEHVTKAAAMFSATKMHSGKAMYACRAQVMRLRHSFAA